ncbi:MAG: Gfo/Idh/MocA family oxidoreductase [Armatimonadota bacterium]
MKRRTIALFGAGFHGLNAVLPALLRLREKLDLVAVVEPAESNRMRAAQAAPNAAVYASPDELFAAHSPDIVYVATLPHLHLPVALQALAAGCHVICEKPLAPTVEECETMIAAAHRAERHLVTMFENRYLIRNRTVREWCLSGRIGRVEAIHLQHFWPGPITEPRRTNLLNASGALDCGIHYLDLARYFVDAGDWATIHAVGQWFDEPDLENPPHITITARLSNGPLVTSTESMSYRIAYANRTGDRSGTTSLNVIGTDGIIESVADGVRLRLTDGTEETQTDERMSHVDEIPLVVSDLLTLLETGTAASGFLPMGTDGLHAQRITAEANRQARASRNG